MIALEYHDNCCGLADPLTPLAAAALPDDVPASSAGELRENGDGADDHTVFDGHRPGVDRGQAGAPRHRGVHRERPRGRRHQSGPGGQRFGLQRAPD